jgi:hypothetical protein
VAAAVGFATAVIVAAAAAAGLAAHC